MFFSCVREARKLPFKEEVTLKSDCKCDSLPANVCVACGKRFKGKHYFTWAIHQAVCKVKKGLPR